MIVLTSKSLPNTVKVGGKDYPVYTDYRVWMKFCIEYERNVVEHQDWDLSYLFSNELPVMNAMPESILLFAFNPNACPKNTDSMDVRVMNYEIDSELIYSAFMQQYGIDIVNVDMHWHKFKALLMNVTEPCKLAKVISYRLYDGKDKDYRRMRTEWELPEIYTDLELVEKEKFDSFFDS